MSNDGENNEIALTEVLTALRAEIEKAQAAATDSGSGIRFNLKDIQVELETVVTKEQIASGGVSAKLFVVDVKAGASAKYTNAMTQKLTFSLEAIQPNSEGGVKLSREEE